MDVIKKNNQDTLVLKEYMLSTGEQLPLFEFPLLSQTASVKHCFTTRYGGVSEGIYSSLNLSFTRGDQEGAVKENFLRVAQALKIDANNFVFSDQTHTTNVRVIDAADAGNGWSKDKTFFHTDGMITNVAGLVLATFYADCVPIFLVDPVNRCIGLVHSGWKGTVGRIGKVAINKMATAFGTKAEHLVCAIGPSICQDCYEVSEDVAQLFQQEFPRQMNEILTAKIDKKYQLNLWRANEIILTEAGVKKEQLAVTNVCTCCNQDLLFSHRASHGKRGNLGAFLSLKEEEIGES
jgi:YfiH family protein